MNIKTSLLKTNTGQIEGLPKNPRVIKDAKYNLLKKSIEENPEMLSLRELLVYPHEGSYILIGGNMRLKACKELGYKEIPCKVIPEETDIETLKAYVIKDNANFGEWDYDMLANEWESEDLNNWGLDIWEDEEKEPEIVEDEAPEVDEENEPIAKLGDIWQLGRHRLMCGSATEENHIKALVNNEPIYLIYTDPPYGMNAVTKSGVLSKNYKTDIMNDNDNTVAIDSFLLSQKLYQSTNAIWWGANYYTECLPSSECWIVWDKNNGKSDQTDCELAWANFRSVVRQFTMASEKTNRVHPTQKPVKLFAEIVNKFDKNQMFKTVLDLFGGSGSTLIACEQLGKVNFTMELDAKFCDVIIKRYENLTGDTAVLLENIITL